MVPNGALPPFDHKTWLKPVGCRVTQFWIWPIPILYTTHHDSYISVSTSISGTVDQHGVSWNQTSTDSCVGACRCAGVGQGAGWCCLFWPIKGNESEKPAAWKFGPDLTSTDVIIFLVTSMPNPPRLRVFFFNLSWFNGDYHDWCDFSWSFTSRTHYHHPHNPWCSDDSDTHIVMPLWILPFGNARFLNGDSVQELFGTSSGNPATLLVQSQFLLVNG